VIFLGFINLSIHLIFFNKGDIVSSVVLNVDIENRRFSLGIKQLTVDPWNDIPSKYSIGTNTSGIVKRITDYGVFVEIKKGLNGLLHMSELSKKDKVSIKQNSKLNVKIIDIDPKMKHIGLTLNHS
jgi:small subunit ribosomal protein S1